MSDDVRRAVEDAHRDEWARVLASTVRVAHDLDLAEESVQEAFAEALTIWERDGIPLRPGAWLTTVARRRTIDSLRRASTQRLKMRLLIEPVSLEEDESILSDANLEVPKTLAVDDTIRLVFMCCHPALSREAQMALTLRLVAGMATSDVARCFLVSESTMAARLTRAKKKIAVAGIPFRAPKSEEIPERLDGVLGVIYLLYTVGHTAPSGGDLVRRETVDDALRLVRLLHRLMPEEREVDGLLALLLVNNARQESRVTEGGVQRISEQDRSKWDLDAINSAHELIVSSLRAGRPGRYTLQAAIASLHAQAPSFDEVDWPQIVQLYNELLLVWPNPVVQLNRAVALSKTAGPEIALKEVETLEHDHRLDQYQYLPAIKAYLLEQLGRTDEADQARSRAFELSANEVERAFLS